MNIHNKESRVVLSALFILLIILGVYIWKSSPSSILPSSSISTTTTTSNSQAEVPVAENKINTTYDKVVPPGFPSDIPIESAHITSSIKSVYTNGGATQYMVSYTSASSQDALMKLYTDSLTKAGYVINKDTTNYAPTTVVPLNAVKGKNILFVVVLNTGKESSVQLNLLVRP
jgi:hypothetical protein